MRYALYRGGRDIDATELCNGTIRSNAYRCIFCKKKVTYVVGSHRSSPHFRHKNKESCMSMGSNEKLEIENQSELRINNNKSHFHKLWQSVFGTNNTEVIIKFQGAKHVADIYLESDSPFTLKCEDEIEILTTKKLVIEVQHSNISSLDAVNRHNVYNRDGSVLLWIIDICHIPHKVERFKTLTQDKLRILFPEKQHTGLTTIIKNCINSIIILDTGSSLFKLNRCLLDDGFAEVYYVSRQGLLKQFRDQGFQVKSEVFGNSNPIVPETRDYTPHLKALDMKNQVDADEVINMIEEIPLRCLRQGMNMYSKQEFKTVIEMVASWIGTLSNKHMSGYEMLNIWRSHIKDTNYSIYSLKFGKYANVPLNKVPIDYLNWLIKDNVVNDEDLHYKILELTTTQLSLMDKFKISGSMKYYNKCRDSYYRINWDTRSKEQRKQVLESIILRPWVKLIPNIIPDSDSFARTLKYNPDVNLPQTECEIEEVNGVQFHKFKPIKIRDVYKAVDEEDLLVWYGHFDAHYSSKYNHKRLLLKTEMIAIK